MYIKDFVIENGQIYYRKKPLHTQPLFWTTIAGAILSIIFGVACFILFMGYSGPIESGYWHTESENYRDNITYTEYQVGESVLFPDGMKVTVMSMGKDDQVELVDVSYSAAYVVEMEVENTTEQDIYFDEYYFGLVDSLTNSYFGLDMRTYDVNIAEKLKPSEKMTVRLVYGIDDETNISFVYQDAMWTELLTEGI